MIARICLAVVAYALGSASICAKEPKLEYKVELATKAIDVTAKWDGPAWRDIKPLELKNFMGERPRHFPDVLAKLTYDDDFVNVIFYIDDRYVIAKAKQHQDSVCVDSCVEFFFTPGKNINAGYFNLEMNCGGTMLFHYQREPGKHARPLGKQDLSKIKVSHDLPEIVDPEITKSTKWTVAYRLPIAILETYFPDELQRPAPGVTWRANLYKCADKSSHPHWLTWSPVDFERPNFHRPQDFGRLLFE